MIIRDRFKLMEISEVLYEEKEGRFVFKDMRNRILAKLSLPNPKDDKCVEYTLQLITRWCQHYGYVDIYKLNQAVDLYKGECIPDDYGKCTWKLPSVENEKTQPTREEVAVIQAVQSENVEVVQEVTTEPPQSKEETVEIKEPAQVEQPVLSQSKPVDVTNLPGIIEGFDTPIVFKESETQLPEPTIEILTDTAKNQQAKLEYIDSFIIKSMQCDTIEKFKELIHLGTLLGIPRDKLIKELRYVSKDKLLAYCRALNVTHTATMTREDIGNLILTTLNY